MFAVVRDYETRAGVAFEAPYGADDGWVARCRTYPGHSSTGLFCGDANRAPTIDRRAPAAVYDIFPRAAATAARLDAPGDALALAECPIGTYSTP